MIKLRAPEYWALCEAMRRFDTYHDQQYGKTWTFRNLTQLDTGLGFPSAYDQAVWLGLMQPANAIRESRRANWYRLTEVGARIVMYWFYAGYGQRPRDYEKPPKIVPDWVVTASEQKIRAAAGAERRRHRKVYLS